MKICSMCKRNFLQEPLVRYCSLSRKDNKTYICNDCGNIEAFGDYFQNV
jgi:predicted RNA-binding Zn-ribbon protein involved in translation (DUF1610 family)